MSFLAATSFTPVITWREAVVARWRADPTYGLNALPPRPILSLDTHFLGGRAAMWYRRKSKVGIVRRSRACPRSAFLCAGRALCRELLRTRPSTYFRVVRRR